METSSEVGKYKYSTVELRPEAEATHVRQISIIFRFAPFRFSVVAQTVFSCRGSHGVGLEGGAVLRRSRLGFQFTAIS